jgi:hypothetical protein
MFQVYCMPQIIIKDDAERACSSQEIILRRSPDFLYVRGESQVGLSLTRLVPNTRTTLV